MAGGARAPPVFLDNAGASARRTPNSPEGGSKLEDAKRTTYFGRGTTCAAPPPENCRASPARFRPPPKGEVTELRCFAYLHRRWAETSRKLDQLHPQAPARPQSQGAHIRPLERFDARHLSRHQHRHATKPRREENVAMLVALSADAAFRQHLVLSKSLAASASATRCCPRRNAEVSR